MVFLLNVVIGFLLLNYTALLAPTLHPIKEQGLVLYGYCAGFGDTGGLGKMPWKFKQACDRPPPLLSSAAELVVVVPERLMNKKSNILFS